MTKTKAFFRYTAAFILLASFASCGKFDRIDNGGFTEVQFSGSRRQEFAISSTLTYGILIYAYSSSYATNLKLSSEDAGPTTSISLPNGTYSFYAFGYGYDINTNGTDVRCAVSPSYALNGTKQTIVLEFKMSTCSNSAFSQDSDFLDSNTGVATGVPYTGPIFGQLELVHCSSAAGTNLSTVSGFQDCSTSAGALSAPWSNVSRFRMSVPIFKRIGNDFTKLAEAYASDCSSGFPNLSGYPASTPLRFPVGSTAFPNAFPMEIETFADSSCTAAPVAKHTFYNGLINGISSGGTVLSKVVANTGSPNRVRVFLREP